MRVWELRPGSRCVQPHCLSSATQPDVPAPVYFFIVSIVLGIVFPLIPIVPALAAFLSASQGLALQLTRISHCRSPVFCLAASFVEIALSARCPSSGHHRGQKRSADRDIGDIGEILGSFCADPKTVASISILHVLIVSMGKSLPRRDRPHRIGNCVPSGTAKNAALGQIRPETGSPIG